MMKQSLRAGFLAIMLTGATAYAHGPSDHGGHAGHNHELAYGEPGDPQKPSRNIVVRMLEADGKMLFEPALIEVGVGEQIRFQLQNAGVLDHEFLLGTEEEIDEHADMMKAMPDMQHDDPNAKRLKPKSNGDLFWRFSKAGEFDFACLIPGHREAGMSGKIRVK